MEKHNEITSFKDLQKAKENLKKTISEQEISLKKNPLIKIAGSLNDSKSVTNSLKNGISDFNLQSAEKLISALLLAFKSTRKYYISFLVAKEMIPFTLQKINELISLKKQSN